MMTTADLPTALRPTATHICNRPDCTFSQPLAADPAPGVASSA